MGLKAVLNEEKNKTFRKVKRKVIEKCLEVFEPIIINITESSSITKHSNC